MVKSFLRGVSEIVWSFGWLGAEGGNFGPLRVRGADGLAFRELVAAEVAAGGRPSAVSSLSSDPTPVVVKAAVRSERPIRGHAASGPGAPEAGRNGRADVVERPRGWRGA